jgi:hypothetical protein
MNILKIEQFIRDSCPECGERIFPLQYLLDNIDFDKKGYVIELGVASGKTINMIGKSIPDNPNIYGFDSFEGLPEAWHDGGILFDKGAFSTNGILPEVPSNVKLIKGWFDDTLPIFKRDILQEIPISLLHIDSDIYSSAKCAFDVFKSNIVAGTIIVFDELWNYPDYKNHEIKAFAEFLEETGFWFEPLVCRRCEYKYLCNKEVVVVIKNS